MNLIDYFNKALTMNDYMPLLDDQLALHQHHYKRARITGFEQEELPELKILFITEPWCIDSTALLPVLQKFFENKNTEIRIALRDRNPDLMERFLTNGGRAIPVIIVLDKEGNYLFRMGPRPQAAQTMFERYRPLIEQGKMEKREVVKKIRQFYARDRGQSLLTELVDHLKKSTKKLSNRQR